MSDQDTSSETTATQSSVVKRYRKKPVVIEAVRFDGSAESADRIIGWAGAEPVANETSNISYNSIAETLLIPTLEGDHRADSGDWIIKGIQGEIYPCKPDIFEATYEPVSGE